MSEIKPSHDNLPITISSDIHSLKDQSRRKNRLLADRTLTRIGEKDDSFREFVFLSEAFEEMIAYGMTDRSVELAGALAGFHQGDQTIVTKFIPAPNTKGSGGAVHISSEDWADIVRVNDQLNSAHGTDDTLVAWFHTHPHNYPPIPSTHADTFIMKGYFSGSDRRGTNDHTTVIMTTYTDKSSPSLAAWKWDASSDEAVHMTGISVATKGSKIKATYFLPGKSERRVKENSGKFVSIDNMGPLSELPDVSNQIKILENTTDHTLNITLLNEGQEAVQITLKDLDPDPEMLRITLDDLTPKQISAMELAIKENPTRKESGLLKRIVDAFRSRNPRRLEDDITIISED